MQADDRDARIAELEAEVVRVKGIAAEQGTQLIRMSIALKMVRQFGVHSRYWSADVSWEIATWIDGGAGEPIPYPRSPFFRQWAESQGLSNCDGHVGYRLIAELESAARAGQERKEQGQ